MKTPLDIAISYIGTKEVSTNRSPEIAKMWDDTSYEQGDENREPWCAAFVCHCLHEAARQGWTHAVKKLPRDASVRNFLKWCQGRPGVKLMRTSEKLLPGDVIIFLPKLSHIGILKSVQGERLFVVEGNTDKAGRREGIEVALKDRAKSFPGWAARFLPA